MEEQRKEQLKSQFAEALRLAVKEFGRRPDEVISINFNNSSLRLRKKHTLMLLRKLATPFKNQIGDQESNGSFTDEQLSQFLTRNPLIFDKLVARINPIQIEEVYRQIDQKYEEEIPEDQKEQEVEEITEEKLIEKEKEKETKTETATATAADEHEGTISNPKSPKEPSTSPATNKIDRQIAAAEAARLKQKEERELAYSIAERIRTYGAKGMFKTAEQREQLMRDRIFQPDEMRGILSGNLIFADGNNPIYNQNGFKDQNEWDKAVYETATNLLSERKRAEEMLRNNIARTPFKSKLYMESEYYPQPDINFSIPTTTTPSYSVSTSPRTDSGSWGKNFGSRVNSARNRIGSLRGAGSSLTKASRGKALAAASRLGGLGKLAGFTPVGRGVQLALLAVQNPKELMYAILAAGALFFIILTPLGSNLLQTTSLLPPYETPRVTSGGASSGSSSFPQNSDISACKFIRGSEANPEQSFKSEVLMRYFRAAGALSGMPPALIAAFARVESPSSVNFTDESLNSYVCAVSPTGALGLMQIQPAGTTGHDGPAVNLGASYIGKTVESLTKADYCDIEKSIIIATGFIIKKMEYRGFSNGGKWNPEWTNNKDAIKVLVEGYYGCDRYPDCTSGPYSYSEDVWKSVQACKVSPTTPGQVPQQTIPSDPQGIQQAIKSRFNITMNGFELRKDLLQWAYRKLESVSNTRLLELVSGTVITASGSSSQTGCNTLNIRSTIENEQLLGIILTHELGHIIRNCKQSQYQQHLDALNREKGITLYARTLCGSEGSTDSTSEDYAEMIAYYLNPDAPEQTSCSGGGNPYANGGYPLHKKVAEDILRK